MKTIKDGAAIFSDCCQEIPRDKDDRIDLSDRGLPSGDWMVPSRQKKLIRPYLKSSRG